MRYEALEGLQESFQLLNHFEEVGWIQNLFQPQGYRALNRLRSQDDLQALVRAFGPESPSSESSVTCDTQDFSTEEWEPIIDDLIGLTLHRFVPSYDKELAGGRRGTPHPFGKDRPELPSQENKPAPQEIPIRFAAIRPGVPLGQREPPAPAVPAGTNNRGGRRSRRQPMEQDARRVKAALLEKHR